VICALVEVEMETKILIFCLLSTIVNAQVVQDNELQRILKSYLSDLKLRSNGIFAQRIAQVSEVSNNEVTFRLVTTHCHRDVDPEQIEDCEINEVEPVSICTMKLYPVIEIETGIEQWTYEQPDCQMERNLRNLDHESVALNDELLGDEFMPLMDRKESTRQLRRLQSHHSFKSFMQEHSKRYPDYSEYKKRFGIFKENMKKVQFLRETERGSGKYGATKFADLTEEEFKERHLGLYTKQYDPVLNEFDSDLPPADIPNVALPESFDWRTKGAVTPVKNQGSCGSCWAFSVTGNVEGQYKIKHGELLSFSEQELVDCDKLDNGCNGGLPENAYKAIKKIGGLELEDDYKYEGDDETCHFNKAKVEVEVSGGVKLPTNETAIAAWLLQNGPISIGINANGMQFYMGGVSHPWKFLCDPSGLDHGVLIVGFGVYRSKYFKVEKPYWLIKNSWGPTWGEQGYYRVFRGDGTCGVNQMATSATIV